MEGVTELDREVSRIIGIPPIEVGNTKYQQCWSSEPKAMLEACKRLVEMGIDVNFGCTPYGWNVDLWSRTNNHFLAKRDTCLTAPLALALAISALGNVKEEPTDET